VSRSRKVLFGLAITALAIGGSDAVAAIAIGGPGQSTTFALRGNSEVLDVAVRCFTRRHRVCPPPCPGGPRVCPQGPRRCYYWTERVCQGKPSSLAPR
jgi:hypothetical protein